MRLTNKQLKQIISETIDEMRIDPVAGHAGNQGSAPVQEEVPKPEDLAELKALIAAHEKRQPKRPLYEPEWDGERGSWVLDFETGDNTHWSINPPEGWEVEQRDIGAYDGDEQYILYKPSQGEL